MKDHKIGRVFESSVVHVDSRLLEFVERLAVMVGTSPAQLFEECILDGLQGFLNVVADLGELKGSGGAERPLVRWDKASMSIPGDASIRKDL